MDRAKIVRLPHFLHADSYDAGMTFLRWFPLVMLLLASAQAHAADVVFPTGSRLGLAPPPGVTMSRNFFGFEDASKNVAIVMVALPPEAFPEIEKSMAADAMQKQGVTLEKREPMSIGGGSAFLVVARQEVQSMKLRKWIVAASAPDMTALVTMQVPDTASEAYPEKAIRAALSSLQIRNEVPVEEQLSLLPFAVGDLAGFRVGGVLAGRAVMLTDAQNGEATGRIEPHIVIAVAPGGPSQGSDRENFARDLFATIPNLKDARLTSSEPLRLGGQQGHQIMATGKDNATGADVTVVQWLRFGTGAYMHFVGVAPTDAWTAAYARFRQVRDAVDSR